jgi:tRNA A37 methylthiotransferase MiaB
MRGIIERRGREPHYQNAAELARKHGMDRLKLYLMVGLPSETDEDIDECVEFVTGLSRIIPVALGVAPFCSKRNTPLDRMPYAGVTVVQARLERLRRRAACRKRKRSCSRSAQADASRTTAARSRSSGTCPTVAATQKRSRRSRPSARRCAACLSSAQPRPASNRSFLA